MYIPKQFEETRVDVMHELIRARPFATLVTLAPDGLTANHIPFLVSEQPAPFGTLQGHVARSNPLWKEESRTGDVLVVFQGPQSYISPSWYATKKETGKVVPTWNYAIVHAAGPLRAIEDRAWLRAFVERLTARNEASVAQQWKVSDAPEEYLEKMLQNIVGIEIPIARLSGKWKVSQNQPAANRASVIEVLQASGQPEAALMAQLIARGTANAS
ncbi:MAG TPA: FMN-binding negative transcriptional regulator [Burkholderiales bacterium]|nr:FMN-binding negative transcriptional regulator [Burkholderiales bacterium]